MVFTHSNPPALTDIDLKAFNAWFEHDSRLPEIARELGLTVVELCDWAEQPHIASKFEAVLRIAKLRYTTLHAESRHQALSRLTNLTRFSENEETARRAADRILRSSTSVEAALPSGTSAQSVSQPATTPATAATPLDKPLTVAVPQPATPHDTVLRPPSSFHPIPSPARLRASAGTIGSDPAPAPTQPTSRESERSGVRSGTVEAQQKNRASIPRSPRRDVVAQGIRDAAAADAHHHHADPTDARVDLALNSSGDG